VGRKNSKTNIGIHGHAGGTRPGQTRKTSKNLSTNESEERGCEESVGLNAADDRGRPSQWMYRHTKLGDTPK
jgi:hypothetical protein